MTPLPPTNGSPQAGARRLLLGCAAIAVVLSLAAAADVALARQKSDATKPKPLPYLEDALAQQAKDLLKQLDDRKKCVRLGVLKFRTKRPGGLWSDNDGPLNQRMADRLEVALVRAMKPGSRIRILRQSSETVAHSKRFNHRTTDGRREFFDDQKYPPAWGREESLPADAFVTGEVTFDAKLERFQVQLQMFERTDNGKKLKDVGKPFEAVADSRVLTEVGVSYTTRARGSPGVPVREVSRVLTQPRALIQGPPVRFEILYNDVVQKTTPLEAENRAEGLQPNDLVVATPQKGQEVAFRLSRAPGDTRKFGVVVKVNGRNTIYPDETQDNPLACYKWILETNEKYLIKGFQTSDRDSRKFTVIPMDPGGAAAMRYGEHAGTISVVVFRARVDGDPHRRDDDGPSIGGGRGASLKRLGAKPNTLQALQNELRQQVRGKPNWPWQNASARGLIGPGERIIRPVQEVDFDPYHEEVAAFTIRYFRP